MGRARVGLVELFVPLLDITMYRAQIGSRKPNIAGHLRRSLLANPAGRNASAAAALTTARELGANPILCPGWTFPVDVAGTTLPRFIFDAVGPHVALFETLGLDGSPVRSWVCGHDAAWELDRQVAVSGNGLDYPPTAAALTTVLRGGRRLCLLPVGAEGLFINCGEMNLVEKVQGGKDDALRKSMLRAGYTWEELRVPVVFNPVHHPNTGYMIAKQRAGPWAHLVTTGNSFDPTRIDYGRLARIKKRPQTARLVSNGKDQKIAPAAVLPDGSRVYVVEVDAASCRQAAGLVSSGSGRDGGATGGAFSGKIVAAVPAAG
jgi:hypothetical protein